MHSSASSDEMFPDEALSNNPATPMNASIQNLTSTSELSPPNSQARDTSTLSGTVNANGKRPLSLAQPAVGTHTDPETGYSWTRQEDQPGWEWRNTRAREDESRALDAIVEQGAQIKCECFLEDVSDMWDGTNCWAVRYGDPLDPSVQARYKR
jgi:hypothetical protein